MTNTIAKSAQGVASGAREYLTFRLNQEEYGIDILNVQEIRGYEAPTRIAHAPHFVKGVVNLRGTIVPIIDMRLRFGCPQVEYNDFTVAIILNLNRRVLGMVVDSVSDVIALAPDEVRSAPDMDSCSVDSSCILGLGTIEERMLILLDMEKLMGSMDLGI